MNKRATLAEAKAHISALVTEASAGAEITITRHGRSVARIVGAPTGMARTPGDWGWPGTYDKAPLALLTEDEQRNEGWPV